jgi:hypothetical protein
MLRTLFSIALTAPLMASDFAQPLDPVTTERTGLYIGEPEIEFLSRKDDDRTELPGYFLLYSGYQHTFEADFQDLPGAVEMDKFSALGPLLPINYGDWHMVSLFYYTYTQFDTTAENSLTNTSQHALTVPIILVKEEGEKWIWGGMVMPTWTNDFSEGGGDSIALAAGAGYSFENDFKLIFGGYYSYRFGEHFAMPGIQFVWRPRPDIETYLLGSVGGVTYSVNEDWLIGLTGHYSSPIWKLESDQPDLDDNTVRVTNFNIALRTEHRLYKNLWGSVSAGVALARELEVKDRNNKVVNDSSIDAAPFIQAVINLRY